MFFIIFVLLFSKSFQTNALQCMTSADKDFKALFSKCEFERNINEAIPSDSELKGASSKCAMTTADIKLGIGSLDGSCYGEVSIDYNTNKMKILLTHAGLHESMISPYDDMFGFAKGIESVVQYKINGNLENEKIQMITRIQCKTYDNCALDKLRKLLSNLTKIEPRKTIFKELRNFLSPSESAAVSELSCMSDENDDQEEVCSNDGDRCKYDRSKIGLEKGCAAESLAQEYDLEYRFNVIENIKDTGDDNSAESLKCFYLCKTDRCNSENNFIRADQILNAFAMASETKTTAAVINENTPTPQKNHHGRKSGVSRHGSFSYLSMIMFFLFIQLLLN